MSYQTIDVTVSGQAARILLPDNYVDRAVVYHHGVGESETGITDDSLKAGVIARLLADGYLVAGSNAHGSNWGNQAALDDYLALQAYLVTNYAPAKTAIFSQSMGGCSGLLTVASGLIANLVAWFGVYPVCSLANMFGGNSGTYASAIRTAFGIASNGSDYSTKTAGYDPLLVSAASFAAIPMRFWASPDDTVVAKTANSDALLTAIAASHQERSLKVCSGDHGDTSPFQPQEVSDFLDRAFTPRTCAWRAV